MKKQRILTITVVALVTLLLSAGPVLAKAAKTEFSCTRKGPLGKLKAAKTEISWIREGPLVKLEEGTKWFTDDGILHLRDRLMKAEIFLESGWPDDKVLIGTLFLVINLNVKLPNPDDPDQCSNWGPMWGTFSIVLDGYTEPSWEGIYTGNGNYYGFRYHKYVGYGTGDFEGLKMRAYSEPINPTCDETGGDPPGKDWYIDGYILRPHGEFPE